MQDEDDNRCFLCMKLNDDYEIRYTEEHHCLFGTANRAISDRLGLRVRLCLGHHRVGDEAVHNNAQNALILKQAAQQKYEEEHSREEWMAEVGRSYL